ncbi:hypothetical protein MSMAT_3307 [Methanosarcina mazei TMA]|uniref:hypothetical protein n=1 Tax=Methanosarcina mazei TaxID=2209 RepID=UPI001C320EF6|nr:hypothetical protein [Methanosarcina mazei]UWJ24563.1 hypothetical protein MSMAT_3307 [Methanosarcina mazei TMA]BBL65941.1 hypothetical protein MmazTMA_29180 [Methanosarcina mazei]
MFSLDNQKMHNDYDAMQKISEMLHNLIKKIGNVDLINEELVPEGLKPIGRSTSWLVEQIIVQNMRKYKDELGLEDVLDPPSNVSLYDCSIVFKGEFKKYYINLKTSSLEAQRTKDDISKADKLIDLYESDPDYTLFIAVIKVIFQNTRLILNHNKNLIVFNVAWIPDIYCNPRNNNLQSSKYDETFFRTNVEFLCELKTHYQTALVKKRKKF